MKYKLMAVDIDGTLLNSRNELTWKTKFAIRQAVERGLIFTICTGRSIQGVQPIIKELGIDLPFITYNGAMIVMGKSREILYEKKLSPEDSIAIIDLGLKFDTTVVAWVDNKLFVNKLNERAESYSKLNNTPAVQFTDPREIIEDGATKILWYDTAENINRFEKEMEEYLGDTVNFHTSQPVFLEFVNKEATKANAMEALGRYFNVTREEMIAVGDGYNDISMLCYAGLGVAMGNAPEEVKKIAGYVTCSNDNDGVAHVIYKYYL